MIAVALGLRTPAEARDALAAAARLADVAELRLDYFQEPYDLASLLVERPCPVIVTNRPAREGGYYIGDEATRVRALQEACTLGAESVDVEGDSIGLLRAALATHSLVRPSTKIIVSHHDFRAVPPDLWEIHQRLQAQGADVVKVAAMAHRLGDTIAILDLLARAEVPTIAIAMGEHGLISRVLALRYPACYLTYAAPDNERNTAPGQVSARTMHDVFEAERIGPTTAVYGTLGPHGGDAAEWRRMTAALRAAGLDAVYVPLKLAADDDLRSCLEGLRRVGLRGARVEEPIQVEAARAVERLDAAARRRGRVDTLYWEGEMWVGEWVGGEDWVRLWVK
ncbi:MAG: type I 3-dehydroquinate dehydratase [Anaerolineae bacterium]|nr:type I 3-dehydroquinate dehydratase [Anaerolineae bacterium]